MTSDISGTVPVLSEILAYLTRADTKAFPELEQERTEAIAAVESALHGGDDAALIHALAVAQVWLEQYRLRYVKSHTTYQAVAREIQDAIAAARANPGGVDHRLDPYAAIAPCTRNAGEVNAGLASSPTCASCGYRLGDRHPRGDALRAAAAAAPAAR